MPLSTGSIDSGFFGCATDDSLKKEDSQDLQKTMPLSMTDEEETSSTSSSGFSRKSAPPGVMDSSSIISPSMYLAMNSGLMPRKHRTRVRRSNRKMKRLPQQNMIVFDSQQLLPASPTVSSEASSCCLSVAGSSRSSMSSSSNSINASIDELALRLYFYFKSLLIAVNRQKTICESIAYLVRDFDARWGNSGVRKKPCDPKGCLAPVYISNREGDGSDKKLVVPSKFPLCWAVPQPAIFYQLMAIDVLEYIKFLERVSPQVKSQSQQPVMPIQNDREASASMEQLKSLQLHRHWHQHIPPFPFSAYIPIPIDPIRVMKSREQHQQFLQQQMNSQRVPCFNEHSPAEKRDSSNDSRCSSAVNPEAVAQIIDELDEEVTGADLDRTPINENIKAKKNDSVQRTHEQSRPKGQLSSYLFWKVFTM
ncbi:hypothetical protein CAEBREN_12630 [Caenorhabditis brenneri]|uniref:Uncharacterized protein n=1 Tax=Caenorhabditis brenneri TaxID=135651 RepID=G0NZA6_CAEBE|nr:hypothetical protein CAEBREN_12630 [Caenorhabditis brenneri]